MRRFKTLALATALVLFAGTTFALAQDAPKDKAGKPGTRTTTSPLNNLGAERFRSVNKSDEIVSILKNGMTVIVKRVPSPVVSVRAYVQTGGVYEGKWLGGGLSHLLEHLVAGGSTKGRTETENRS